MKQKNFNQWARTSRKLAQAQAKEQTVARAISRFISDDQTALTTSDIKRMVEIYKKAKEAIWHTQATTSNSGSQ